MCRLVGRPPRRGAKAHRVADRCSGGTGGRPCCPQVTRAIAHLDKEMGCLDDCKARLMADLRDKVRLHACCSAAARRVARM